MNTPQLNLLIAFGAGLVSFCSPCVLPLVPSYLAFLTGTSYRELQSARGTRRQIVARSVWFVVGLSSVFVGLGVLAGGAGILLARWGRWYAVVAGTIVALLGLYVLFGFNCGFQRRSAGQPATRPVSALGALVVGMAFAVGWTPCIGPILAAILLLAATQASTNQAALLLTSYAVGFGLPFVVAGYAFERFERLRKCIRPRLPTIRVVSGITLTVVGISIALQRFQRSGSVLVRFGTWLIHLNAVHSRASAVLSGLLLLLLAAVGPLVRLLRRKRSFTAVNIVVGLALVGLALATLLGRIVPVGLLGRWLGFVGL